MDEREDKIRQRAYEIWLAAGNPEGSSEQFWLEAEQELFGNAGSTDRNEKGGDEKKLDDELDGSFPTSDPPSATQP